MGTDAMKSRFAGVASGFGSTLLAGIASSVIAVQVVATWITTCGASSISLVTALFSATLGVLLSGWLDRKAWSNSRNRSMVLAILLVGMSWSLPTTLNALLYAGAGMTLDSAVTAYLLPALIVCIQSAVLASWVRGSQEGRPALSFLSGVSVGFLIPIFSGVFVLPFAVLVTTCVAISVAARFISNRQSDTAKTPDAHEAEVVVQRPLWQGWLAAGAAGIVIHAGFRIASLLMPVGLPIALVAGSFSIATLLFTFVPAVQRRLSERMAICAAAALCLVPVLFGTLVNSNLSINASVSSVTVLTLLRALQLTAVWSIALIGWRCVGSQTSGLRTSEVAVWLGSLGASVLLTSLGLSLAVQLLLAASLFVVPFVSAKTLAPRFLRRSLVAAAVLGCGVITVVVAPIDGATATQLLFNARSAQGHRLGLKPGIIAQSHCTRLLEEHNSDGDHLTVWRTGGDQVLLRRNGIPAGQVTANSQTTPQPIQETLTTLLPLVMHRRAQSVLLLGDDSGTGLRLCTQFPLHTIEAVRPHDETTDIARRYVWAGETTSPENDHRVTLRQQDISIAVRTPRKPEDLFDVVVAASPNPVSLRCQDQLTTEFYAAVKSQLNERGVFCQRIVQHDLGSEPLLRVVSAMNRVFGRVVVTQMALGQVAVVASVDPRDLLDEQLLGRLSREHVVKELSRSGWDWSQVAALAVVDTNDPVGIFEHEEMLASASSSNAHFAVGLPMEASRWGNKASELQQMFAPHQQRMVDAAPHSAAQPEFVRRFRAVVQQVEILTSFPDNPWPYRKSLKMEMQTNPGAPRETIENGELVRRGDSLDEYRKEYFVTLGKILGQATQGLADPLTLKNFDFFTRRYEPLLSLFARHELIRVHEATGHPSPAQELQHRLYTIYFSSGGDFSIRHINLALTQLLDDPELLPDDANRFDHVNSLLQELVRRWEVRIGYTPPSASRTQQDVDDCVRVANRGLDAMETWADSLQIGDDELKFRRRFINQALISPLRTYQQQVVSHRIKHAQKVGPTSASADADDLPMLTDPADLLTN